MSVALPAANGMKALIGFAGQSCAAAGLASTPAATANKTIQNHGFDLRITPHSALRRPTGTCRSSPSCSFYAVQAVRGVLDGKEHDIGAGAGSAVMHRVGGNVEYRAGLGLDRQAADRGVEGAFEDVNPLLVGVRMRGGAGARRHAHEADDHAIALDAGAIRRRIIRTTENVIHIGEVEEVFAGAGPFGARRTGGWGRSSRAVQVCGHVDNSSARYGTARPGDAS